MADALDTLRIMRDRGWIHVKALARAVDEIIADARSRNDPAPIRRALGILTEIAKADPSADWVVSGIEKAKLHEALTELEAETTS